MYSEVQLIGFVEVGEIGNISVHTALGVLDFYW
jgi:hypothetical protein